MRVGNIKDYQRVNSQAGSQDQESPTLPKDSSVSSRHVFHWKVHGRASAARGWERSTRETSHPELLGFSPGKTSLSPSAAADFGRRDEPQAALVLLRERKPAPSRAAAAAPGAAPCFRRKPKQRQPNTSAPRALQGVRLLPVL